MKGKQVLTPKEKAIMKYDSRIAVNSIQYKAIEIKLKRFQESITDSDHIISVNAYIPQAENMAMRTMPSGEQKMDVKKFCAAMNRLTKANGLRC